MMKGIPRKYILRYSTESSITSSGTFMSLRSGRAISRPQASRKKPLMSARETAVCTASFIFFFSF